MTSTAETGHAKNVANLGTMISRVQGYGTRYNPSNTTIKIPNLQTILTNSTNAMTGVNSSKPAYTNAVNTRQQLFTDMEKLATRVLNALDASQNVSDALVDDGKTIIRKIRGARKDKKVVTPPSPDAIAPPTEKQISASQQSYDQQAEHFTKLVSLVASASTYLPNEAELQNASLNTFLTNLKNANTAVINATTPYLIAVQNRNNVMYTATTGLVDIALEVKKYVKSVKTITLTEFRQISGLKFTRPRKQK